MQKLNEEKIIFLSDKRKMQTIPEFPIKKKMKKKTSKKKKRKADKQFQKDKEYDEYSITITEDSVEGEEEFKFSEEENMSEYLPHEPQKTIKEEVAQNLSDQKQLLPQKTGLTTDFMDFGLTSKSIQKSNKDQKKKSVNS